MIIEDTLKESIKKTEELNKVKINKIKQGIIEGERDGESFTFMKAHDYNLENYDTIFFVGEPFTNKEIERFRNLLSVFDFYLITVYSRKLDLPTIYQ